MNSRKIHELQVTMLGPSGVGKTTLLTAMYEQFESTIGSTDLQLTPDEDSASILQDRLNDLKSMLDVFEARSGAVGIEGSDKVIRNFYFALGKRGKTPAFRIKFSDYHGGLITDGSLDQKSEVKNILRSSVAILIAIDSPFLMEQNGKFHGEYNKPELIRDLLKQTLGELQSPKLIILAPVKCEKYLKDRRGEQELLKRVKQGYGSTIELLRSEQYSSNIAIVITPIQTIGSVIFSSMKYGDYKNRRDPQPYFRKTSHDAIYSPVDSEQPLRYLLSFLLKVHLKNANKGVWGFIKKIFDVDKPFKEAIQKFSQGCKTDGAFKVIKGQQWLNF